MKYQTIINANFAQSGSGSITAKLPFPISTLRDIGITDTDRAIEMQYNPEKKEIILKKYIPLETFDMKFEYKFVEKINECYGKIMTDNFEKTGAMGTRWTFSRCMGGRKIGNEFCERNDRLLFDNKIVIQILLQKSKILLFVDNTFFEKNDYQPYIMKLESELKNLTKENDMVMEEMQEAIGYIQ